MNKRPSLVTIVVPIFNSEKNIIKCVTSICDQTYQNVEILLINDGSTDQTITTLYQLASSDERIRVINKENEGVAKTRNLGIQLASGKYLMFIDHDDFIARDYVEAFVTEIESADYDIVIGGYKRVDSNGKTLFSDFPRDSDWGKYVILAPWAKIFKLDFIISNKVSFLDYEIGEDIIFNINAYCHTKKITHIPYMGYTWVYNGDSISNTSQKGFNKCIDILYLLQNVLSISAHQEDVYLKYFIKRYYIWYLLFSGRRATSKEFISEHRRIKDWIKENKLDCSLNPLSRKLTGEGYRSRLIVMVFRFFEKTNLLPLFAKSYCRDNKNSHGCAT